MLMNAGTEFEYEITKASAAHKYGGDPMAEYLDHDTTMRCDEYGGNVDSPTGWFARFGRRILRSDDRGFVWVETFDTLSRGLAAYDFLCSEFDRWDVEEF